jgi:DNA-binding transcriptional LysR family regulator
MDNRSFDIFDLQLFQTVAKAGSLSAAADLIDLPLSTVSRRIKQLEDRAHSRLFERTNRGLILTEAGDYLLTSSDIILKEFDLAFSHLDEHNTVTSGRIVVRTPPSTFTHLFPTFLTEFNQQYSDIDLDIVTSVSDICFTDERIDVFLHPGPVPDKKVIAKHLFDTKFDYFASRQYVEQYGMPTLENIKQHKIICFAPFVRHPQFWGINQDNPILRNKPYIISDDFLLCSQQICAGLGIGILPDKIFANNTPPDNLVALFHGKYRRIQPSYAVVSSKRYLPNKVKVFVESFAEHVQRK